MAVTRDTVITIPTETSLDIVALIAAQCDQLLDLKNASLSKEYFYQSLPLCAIDAVFSIGIKYESVRNVVRRYCDYFGLQRLRSPSEDFPPVEEQESVASFLERMSSLGLEKFTNEIFANRCRTSTVNGILKTEAVLRFAEVLHQYGVDYFQDVPKVLVDRNFEDSIRCIPGQRSGIALGYFFMLSGSNDLIKPDRMILRFLTNIVGRSVTIQEARSLLSQVSQTLNLRYPHITPRLLDYEIWKYQRGVS